MTTFSLEARVTRWEAGVTQMCTFTPNIYVYTQRVVLRQLRYSHASSNGAAGRSACRAHPRLLTQSSRGATWPTAPCKPDIHPERSCHPGSAAVCQLQLERLTDSQPGLKADLSACTLLVSRSEYLGSFSNPLTLSRPPMHFTIVSNSLGSI
jgi:hypothetical protein